MECGLSTMQIVTTTNPQALIPTVERYCRHQDHLKHLAQEYHLMRTQQTYARLADPTFRTDAAAMAQSDSRAWLRTSLVVKLTPSASSTFVGRVGEAYQAVSDLIHHSYPDTAVDVYFDSAHITVKTLAEDQAQSVADLRRYRAIIQPIVTQWLAVMAGATQLYAWGLFSSLTKDKGLSVGIRFYPTLPLLQIIRGEVGVALYQQAASLGLRLEAKFHTALTHCTGLRARLVDFPVADHFLPAFKRVVESYDATIFGALTELCAADFVIRHGYSDQLVPLVEVDCGE
jgi:hypothetical protein